MAEFKNMKFRVSGPEQSEALQKVLQSLGYDWRYHIYKEAQQFLDKPFIHTEDDGKICQSHEDYPLDEDAGEVEVDTALFLAAHTPPAKFLEDAFDSRNTGSLEDALSEKYDMPPDNGCPWFENTAEICPISDGDTKIDFIMRDYSFYCGGVAKYARWTKTGLMGDIMKWRYHNSSDYFKQPKTRTKVNLPESAKDSPEGDACVNLLGNVSINWVPTAQPFTVDSGGNVQRNKYMREIKPGVFCDVYDVLRAFEVVDGALAHMIKKCLAVGKRGHKDAAEDYDDIVKSATRAQELHKEWSK